MTVLLLLLSLSLVPLAVSDGVPRRTNSSCDNAVNVVVSDRCCSADVTRLQKKITKLTAAVEKLQSNNFVKQYEYPVTYIDGSRWRAFWWFKARSAWPATVDDVLKDEYGKCNSGAPYCFGRLPSILKENLSEMLGEDSAGNIYRWKFNSTNTVAHETWKALHDHVTVYVKNKNPWMPKVVKGQGPSIQQDSVQYRMEHGVRSLIVDDDGCDCKTSLSMGHGICGDSFSTSYGPENVFGVDLLYDPHCQTPNSQNGLTLYFRDDDDCANVNCPAGTSCRDQIYSYTCE